MFPLLLLKINSDRSIISSAYLLIIIITFLNPSLCFTEAPTRPELSVSVGNIATNMYKEGDTLIATCVVRQGRPAANITWFIGKVYLVVFGSTGAPVSAACSARILVN